MIDEIKLQILSGRYTTGEHFPSVRELAADAAVNPNTMQRALASLEQQGLLIGSRTSGRMVTSDESMIRTMREELADNYYDEFHHSMSRLGYSDEEMRVFITQKC